MTSGQLNANVEQYRQAAAMNTPPPQIVSDPLVTGPTPIEQLLRVLGLAANLSDAQDNAASAEQHAERDARTQEAAEKFAAQDEQAAAELAGIDGEPYLDAEGTAAAPDQSAAMAQQVPQMASGIAGALAGAVGGALQPLSQIPQQAAQGIQQALQTGMGLFGQAAGATAAPIEDANWADAPLVEDFSAGDAALGDLGAGAGGGGDIGAAGPGATGGGGADLGSVGGTAPMSYLGPPPVPSASTAPSSAPITPIAPTAQVSAPSAGAAGMAGMPMIPPGAMTGTTGADKDLKPETKRVSAPPVRNGAPVQGRLTVPPTPPPVIKRGEGAPAVTRRIVAPASAQPDDVKPES